jgi:hypothetical protein
MFDSGNDHMLTLALLCQGQSLDRKIVALRATAGKNNVLRTRPDKVGHLSASNFYSLPRPVSPIVQRGWITEDFSQVRHHYLPHLGEKGGAGSIIQIYLPHIYLLIFRPREIIAPLILLIISIILNRFI